MRRSIRKAAPTASTTTIRRIPMVSARATAKAVNMGVANRVTIMTMATTMATAITTITAMTTTTTIDRGGIDPARIGVGDFYRLMAWFSPAYPIGAFSYSHGIGYAVEAGRVKTAASLSDWIGEIQIGRKNL